MNICYSGGAKGSDKLWGELADKLGHAVCHYSFSGHGVSVPKRFVEILSQDMLNEADEYLKLANKTLQRGSFPYKSEYTNNLLRRNYWQIKNSDSVYAIATIVDNCVQGGTAWAVEMARNKGIPVHLFVPKSDLDWPGDGHFAPKWLHSDPETMFGMWHFSTKQTPKPSGNWTGIGTRYLTDETKEYIINFMLGDKNE